MNDDLRRLPWFTLIAAICLLSLPASWMASAVMGYYKTSFARWAFHALIIGGCFAPFAALFAALLARKRGEGDLQGCLVLSLVACGLMIVLGVLILADYIRR